jgi:hypothetical protein
MRIVDHFGPLQVGPYVGPDSVETPVTAERVRVRAAAADRAAATLPVPDAMRVADLEEDVDAAPEGREHSSLLS